VGRLQAAAPEIRRPRRVPRSPAQSGGGVGGKPFGLVRFLADHGAAVEADLLRYYRVDLTDLYRGRLSPRRVAVLVAALPADASTVEAVHGDQARWTLTDHLLASVFDALAVISWQLGGDKRAARPKPMARPGVADTTRRYGKTVRSRAEVVAYLRRFAPTEEEVTIDG
jgi:hypothetical protein